MTGYIVRRLFAAAVTVWLVVTGVFLIFFVLPGGSGNRIEGGFSPVAVFIAGRNNSPSTLRQIERDLGLNRSIPSQYALFMSRLARGDMGFSYNEPENKIPVRPMVTSSMRPTVELALGASVVALAGGIGGGMLSVRRKSRWTDRVLSGVSIMSLSIPTFVVGALALAILSNAGVYELGRYQPLSEGLVGWLGGMWLPWIVLAFPFVGIYFRLFRTSLLNVAHEDFILTAKAKGLSERDQIRHQMRAGFMPIVTAYGIDLGSFLGGSIIVETIFQIPGLGGLIIGATRGSDFPVVAGVAIVGATAVVLLSLAVDIAYAYLDPRIAYGSEK